MAEPKIIKSPESGSIIDALQSKSTEKIGLPVLTESELIDLLIKETGGSVRVTKDFLEVELPDSVEKITFSYMMGVHKNTGRNNFWVEDKNGAHDYYLYFRRKEK